MSRNHLLAAALIAGIVPQSLSAAVSQEAASHEAGEAASGRLRKRAERADIWVGDLVPVGEDFNVDLVERGVEQLRRDLEQAMKKQLAGD